MRALAAVLSLGRLRVVTLCFCPAFALTLAHRALCAAAIRARPAALIVGRFTPLCVPPKLAAPRALIALSNLFNSRCTLLRSALSACTISTFVYLRT